MNTGTSAFPDSKNHYKILDGLRGVAAILVVGLHILEIFSGGDHAKQIINHGYLAVDFFFLLSGFVIGHAYNDRWNKMSPGDFFRRRFIRLHPMIIAGMVIGAIGFYFGASPVLFPAISSTPVRTLLLVMFIGFTLIPVPLSLDIRGWGEMHPLNGPAWSLFFEYVANILYAFVLVKLPNKILFLLTVIAAAALIHLAVTSSNGDLIGGWSLEPAQFRIGITRLLYPFLAGLLLSRLYKPHQINNTFLLCCLLMIVVFAFPRVGNAQHLWMNGLYDSLSVVLVFPVIILLGAGGAVKSKTAQAACEFLGNISYPLYMVHYPFIYIFSAYIVNHRLSLQEAWPLGLGVFISVILLAYAVLKWYDAPVRKWLSRKLLRKNVKPAVL